MHILYDRATSDKPVGEYRCIAGKTGSAERSMGEKGAPLQAGLKRLKRSHDSATAATAAAPSRSHITACSGPVHTHTGSRHDAHIKQKALSKQDQRRYMCMKFPACGPALLAQCLTLTCGLCNEGRMLPVRPAVHPPWDGIM